MPTVQPFRTLAIAAALGAAALSCSKRELAERRFYELNVQPIFDGFCVGNTSPCHRVDPATGTALGNLDLTSFEAAKKRPDLLRSYGVYPLPQLLLKSVREEVVSIEYAGKLYRSEIRHVGGKPLALDSVAFQELRRWLANGATRDGLRPEPTRGQGLGGCSPTIPPGPMPSGIDRQSPAYALFASEVQGLLKNTCGYSNCHGSPQADFHLTCGSDAAQTDFNFARAAAFVVPPGNDVERSELLLRPLHPGAGGISHTGGTFFASRKDGDWKKLRDFAALVQQAPPQYPPGSAGERFFAEHVMPVLITRGCAFEGCHSPNGFNDFRLRPGAPGFVSPVAVRRNYETALHEFMAIDAIDVRQSRLVRKNLGRPDLGGIVHRGGELLEGPITDSSQPCPQPYDPATASAFCTLHEWHRIERQDHAAAVSPLGVGSRLPLVFVKRPPDPDSPLEFDTFRGGADLMLADAVIGMNGAVDNVENVRSALAPCVGLVPGAGLDVRGPEWSYDATKVVFAARQGEASGLDLWLLDVADNACRRLTNDNGRQQGAARVHNLDPVFAPDGSLVFASTRAGTLSLKRFLPATNLYRVGPALDFSAPEQMTWLTNSELAPAFMGNGQLSFTAEKASPDFYQLSGRRINWDLTDYHPLIAQRAESSDTFMDQKPSVGYRQATEIREDLDRNFLFILSNTDARGGGGALGIFNRSVGPFEEGRRAAGDITFLESLTLADPTVTGRAGTQGVYRSPHPTPNGDILAAYAGNVTNPAADTPRYDLVLVNPITRARRTLVPGGADSLVEPALGYKRSGKLLFKNVVQLVFGGHASGDQPQAIVHFPDLPMLATLLDANLRRGRNRDAFAATRSLRVYESLPPPQANPSGLTGVENVYTMRALIGSAGLEKDGSLRVAMPAKKPLILELVAGNGQTLFTLREEHQLGPGEIISPGVPAKLFNGVCGGCHGSASGRETDVAVTPDALTSATASLSRDATPKALQ